MGQDWWMNLRFQWKASRDALHLLSEPYLGQLQTQLNSPGSQTLYPKLYFSYNAKTQQTTIITTDLNRSHLWMIRHLKQLAGMSIRPEEIGRLIVQHFVVVRECFTAAATWSDARADGPVRCNKLHLQLCLPPIPNSVWHHKCWTALQTTMPVFGMLKWKPESQI